MRSASNLLAQAITQGVVACADVLDGAVTLVPCPRSNLVHRMEVNGVVVAYVKQQGQATATDGLETASREAAVLRGLAGAPVSGLLHADDDAVWTAPTPGIPLHDALPRDPVAVARALGTTLAALHLHPLPETPVPDATRPWPITGEAPASVRSAPDGTLAADLASRVLEGRTDEACTVRRAGRQWRRSHWIHGDLSAANVLVTGFGPTATVRLIDLEDGGLGDPSWDVVCAMRVLDDCLGLADDEAARHGFLQTYAAGSGPGVDHPGLRLAHDLMTDTRSALSELVSWGRVQQVLAS